MTEHHMTIWLSQYRTRRSECEERWRFVPASDWAHHRTIILASWSAFSCSIRYVSTGHCVATYPVRAYQYQYTLTPVPDIA
eukprot:508294-Rhodomonas_salina.3